MAGVTVSVTVDKRALERLVRRGPAEAERVTRERAVALRQDIQQRMPRDTGRTARATREVRKGPYDWAVEIPAVPGRFLIEGTRAHVIRPRFRHVLRFFGPAGVVFARVVHHPGTRPNPFAEDAARAAQRPFARLVAAIFGGT